MSDPPTAKIPHFTQYGIAAYRFELARSVLTLATLGLGSKFLKLDPEQLNLFGVSFTSAPPYLIPGLFGLVLFYTFAAYLIAVMETSIENKISGATAELRGIAFRSRAHIVMSVLQFLASIPVYSMPWVLGTTALVILRSDIWATVALLWELF